MPISIVNRLHNYLRASRPKGNEPTSVTLTADVDILAAPGAGKLPAFSIVAYTGSVMQVSAFYTPVILDLQGMSLSRSYIPTLRDHDASRIVGQTSEHDISAAGLTVKGTITDEGIEGQQIISNAKNGFRWQASIGASIVRREFLDAGKTANVNGKQVTGPLLIARESVVHEVSFVAIGADQNTAVNVAASQTTEEQDMPFAQWLQARGFDPGQLDATQIASLQALYDTEKAATSANNPNVTAHIANVATPSNQVSATVTTATPFDVTASIQAMRAESARIARINVIAAGLPEISAKAIGDGWSEDKTELEVLRAKRGAAPAIHVVDRDMSDAVIECAIATTGGLDHAESRFDEQTLEASRKAFRHGIGLQQLMLVAASRAGNGAHFTTFRENPEGVLRAAFSTHSLSGILSNVANKFLLAGYSAVENTWDTISAKRSVNDFKAITSYRMTGGFEFEQVGPSGEIKHATAGEESYTNQAKTYGKMFAITRADLINDDLGALSDVPRRIGRGAAIKLNKVFWLSFLDNSMFFTTGHGNLITSGTYALSATGLKKGVETFRKQVDSDGNPLAVTPKYLLVPPELETTAEELFKSTNFNTGGASTTEKVPNTNVFANKYMPLVSTYLSNANMSGYSTTAWYLLADPMDVATIEVAFLNGQRSPTVESADADFNVLGIQMRGYFDFGVSKQDYRGGVRANGA